MNGRYVTLEKLDAQAHAAQLFEANSVDDGIWDYLPYGPFEELKAYREWVMDVAESRDPHFWAVRSRGTGLAVGVLSYLRIDAAVGSIEVGHINFSKSLQRSPAATEAVYLLMKWAFDSGYRRFEWKCDALNLPSRRAAQRLGLSFEGVFRQATIYKGRNRDTAWFAAIDAEWAQLRTAFENWLDPDNFDQNGVQKSRLADATSPILVACDPAI